MHDEVGDGVRDRDGAEQGGEFDEVAAPVVAADAGAEAGLRSVMHITVAQGCCVIANDL
ncbi:hypothetical protein [Streptomyces xanthophaeus]|uniref:hypothetical protein n=1 Tax=Streptomyces xanthophaeus TaxID=67385 RepID=UPI0012FEDD95|nr:hypothetical protein [Streptomyces xanthophaeus]